MRIEDLEALRGYRRELDRLEERIARLRSAMEYGQRQLTGMPKGSPEGDKLARNIALLDALMRRRLAQVAELEQRAQEVENALQGLPRAQRDVLRLRYVEGWGWGRIALEVDRERRYCLRLRDRGLKKLQQF